MKHKHFILIILLIVVLSIIATAILNNKKDGSIAEIYSNNTLIHTVDLNTVTESYEIPVKKDGQENIILIEKDKISVKSADCPDKLCVKQGSISSSSYPIVCVPNNLYIKIIKSSSEDIDAISR